MALCADNRLENKNLEAEEIMSGTITFHVDYNDAAKTAAECEGLGEVQVMVHGLGWVVIVWQNEG